MAYMGFGMRKEVYTRKPKKAFEKVNKVYGDAPELSKTEEKINENSTDSEVNRFKHFNQTVTFKFLLVTTLIFAVGYFSWDVWLIKVFKEYQLNKFEKSGIADYYKANTVDFEIIINFMHEKRDRISHIEYENLGGAYSITTKDKRITNNTSSHLINYYSKSGYPSAYSSKDKIQAGQLIIDNAIVVDNWVYSFIKVDLKQIDQSFFDYLDDSSGNFNRILSIVKNKNISVRYFDNYITITFDHNEYGKYSFVFTEGILNDSFLALNDHEIVSEARQIERGVYWIKHQRKPV
jgi:hypothetical protein